MDDLQDAVTRAQAGDAEAFGLIYDATHARVTRYLGYQLGDRQAVEDATQETYLRALRAIGRFVWAGPSSVEAWLVTIARNLLTDRSRRRPDPVPLGLPTAWVRHPAGPGADAQLLRDAEDRLLLAAVRRLPDDQRECVALRFMLELPTTAVATIMGRTTTAVTSLQYRAIRALQRQLDRTRPPGRRELSTAPRGRLDVHRIRPAR